MPFQPPDVTPSSFLTLDMDNPQAMNPLLDFNGLPRFPDIKTEHITPAVDALITQCQSVIEAVTQDSTPATWKAFVEPMEIANEQLSRAWGQVGHLNAVMNSPELRKVYNDNLPKITAYYTDLGQNEALFKQYKALKASAEFLGLNPAQQQIVKNELRDFRLGGAELVTEKKAQFKAICEKLSQLSAKFSDNVLDATNAFSHCVSDEKALKGLPADIMEAAQEAAKKEGLQGWKFTLHAPSYLPVMQYAEDRAFRQLMYRAYVTRASELGSAALDNTPLIKDIVRLRQELAHLLGFKNYAQYSLEPKMAQTPEEVSTFLLELAQRAKPYAQKDLQELQDFAKNEAGLDPLEPWDIAFVSEKLRVARYAFSEQEVKDYLPETTVIPGMFQLIETLYGLSITPTEAPRWSPEVRFYSIHNRSGQLIGQFYLDLFARSTKRGGAWMDEAITRKKLHSGIQVPVAYLNCNFSGSVGGQPAQFTHDEVITLFHEFGHGLHHLLTEVNDLGVSGIHGVEWDAVELPSQFMENFCWEWDVLRPMTRHYKTGKPLPKSLFDKMLAAKNFHSGLQMLRQIEFSLFDLELHDQFDPSGSHSVLDLLNDIRARVAVLFPPDYHRFANSFTHIFAGGYAAGYFSYKWAEVLSADAFSLFEEKGVLNPEVGQHFRQEILAVGGSRPAMDSFKAFRGRAPNIEALLRHNGMSVAA